MSHIQHDLSCVHRQLQERINVNVSTTMEFYMSLCIYVCMYASEWLTISIKPVSSNEFLFYIFKLFSTIREDPEFKRFCSGSLLLKPSPEALRLLTPGASGGKGGYRARTPEEVEAQAQAHFISMGGDPGNAKLVLSCSTLEFGKYQGQTFRWLMENDVG